MTDTALSLDRAGTAVHETALGSVRAAERETRATRVFSGALVAAVVTAVMVVIASGIDRSDAGNELLGWVGLWAVAFAALMGGAHVSRWLARYVRSGWAAWQQHRMLVQTEDMMAAISREDPRLYRELQIIRDRTEWASQRLQMH